MAYEIVKLAARQPRNEGMRATVKVVGSFMLYAMTYAALGVAIGLQVDAWAGATAAVLAPLTGYVALRCAERLDRIGGLLAGARLARRRDASVPALLAERARLVELAGGLLASEAST